MMKILKNIALMVLLVGLASFTPKERVPSSKKQRYNVLFIAIDDLRPELGCYGNSYMHTPNIDQIAREGTAFNKQYVTVPTCGASRSSMLTGLRPRTAAELGNGIFEEKVKAPAAGPESLIAHFKDNGYYTVGIGKISHSPDGYIYKYLEPQGKDLELPHSWNEMLFNAGKWGTGWNAFFGYADGSNRNTLNAEVKPYEAGDVDDEGYPDGLTAKLAVAKLAELGKKEQPFFLGVGFFKPHLPFNAPKKYWDLYDESGLQISPTPSLPESVSLASLHQSSEFNGYKKGDQKAALNKPLDEAYTRKLRHAYYAGVSYVDAQVGKILAQLKKSGLDKNTIIVVWGDHGWHLGDHRVWGKHTLSEWSLRSPLIISSPGSFKKGAVSEKVASSVDIYPTLMELCQIEMPYPGDGKSLVALLKNPNLSTWNNVAYSYFKKGVTMRTDRYRFTKYNRKEMPVEELYDHQKDPFEDKNVAKGSAEVVAQLKPLWSAGAW